MIAPILTPTGPVPLTIGRLTADLVPETAALCARCAGEGLHTEDDLRDILDRPDHAFFLLLAPNGTVAGYQHLVITDAEKMAAVSKLPAETYLALSEKRDPIIADLRSTGVDTPYRSHAMARLLLENSLAQARARWKADLAVGVCWKNGEEVPIAAALRPLGFQYLTDAQGVWSDCETLICPCCSGRCQCAAAVYYKHL